MWFQLVDLCMLNAIYTDLNLPLHQTPCLVMPCPQITVTPSRMSIKKPSIAHLATVERRPATRSLSLQRFPPSLHVSDRFARDHGTKGDCQTLTGRKEVPFLFIPWCGEVLCIQLCIHCKSSWQDRGRPIEKVEHGSVAPVFGSAQRLGRSWTSREEEDVDIVSIEMGVECLTKRVSPHNVLYDISTVAKVML